MMLFALDIKADASLEAKIRRLRPVYFGHAMRVNSLGEGNGVRNG